MTTDEAIRILSEAAHGHAFTTGPQLWEALQLAINALLLVHTQEKEYHQ